MKKVKNCIVFSILSCILIGFFISIQSTFAYGRPAWNFFKKTYTTGSQNEFVINIHDANNENLIVPDWVSVQIANYSTGAILVNWSCSGNCAASNSITGIPSGVPININTWVTKAGYTQDLPGPSGAMRINSGFQGNTLLIIDAYLTTSGTEKRTEIINPAPVWYNYIPGEQSYPHYPAFWATSHPQPWPQETRVRLSLWTIGVSSQEEYHGPYYPPYPQTINVPPWSIWYSQPDGWKQVSLQVYDDWGYESTFARINFGIDRSAPTPSCQVNYPYAGDYKQAEVVLNATDSLSGIGAGDVDVSINGGSWTNTNLPSNGDLTNTFTYTVTSPNTYAFRYRARDNAIDSSGNYTQWSGYTTCTGSIISPTSIPTPTSILPTPTPVPTRTPWVQTNDGDIHVNQ